MNLEAVAHFDLLVVGQNYLANSFVDFALHVLPKMTDLKGTTACYFAAAMVRQVHMDSQWVVGVIVGWIVVLSSDLAVLYPIHHRLCNQHALL